MLTILSSKRIALIALLLTLALAGCTTSLVPGVEAANSAKSTETLTVDLAQDMTTVVMGEAPFHEDGLPAYGNRFIIQGFIYPEGTLDGSNGIIVTQDEEGNPIVEPEFPDKVIGTWTCRGWFVGDGLHSQDEPSAASTQIFDFHEGYGGKTIVSEGYELPFGLDADLHRAITGGTGPYVGVRGEQIQRFLGMNTTQAANFRIELNLDKQ